VTQVLSRIAVGTRFRVRSQSGSLYALTLLHRGDSVIVRMDDQRVARLDTSRIVWDSLIPASHSGEWVLVVGDQLILEVHEGRKRTLRGTLSGWSEDDVRLNLPAGTETRIARRSLRGLQLLFRATDLKQGDEFIVHSQSGREYRGTVLVFEDGVAEVSLVEGKIVRLRLERLDLDTLQVLIPLPCEVFAQLEGGASDSLEEEA
jgi:hypothetical protein